jgi:hypothetical protein
MENTDPTAPKAKPDRKATKAHHHRRRHHRIATRARKETKDPPDRLAPLDLLDQKVNPAPKDRTGSPAAPAAAELVSPVLLDRMASPDRKETPAKTRKRVAKAQPDPKARKERPDRPERMATKEPTENLVQPDHRDRTAHQAKEEKMEPRDLQVNQVHLANLVRMPNIVLVLAVRRKPEPKCCKPEQSPDWYNSHGHMEFDLANFLS